MVNTCTGPSSFQCHRAWLKFPTEHLSHGRLCFITAPLSEQWQEEALGGKKRCLGWRGGRWKVGLLTLAPLMCRGRCDIPAKHWEQKQRQKNMPRFAGNVSASRQLREETGFIQPNQHHTFIHIHRHKLHGFPLAHTTSSKKLLAARALLEAFNHLVESMSKWLNNNQKRREMISRNSRNSQDFQSSFQFNCCLS